MLVETGREAKCREDRLNTLSEVNKNRLLAYWVRTRVRIIADVALLVFWNQRGGAALVLIEGAQGGERQGPAWEL